VATDTTKSGVWKSGTGRGRRTPKGRQVTETALSEIQALLGDKSRQRDLLIEHLHLIQDKYKHISADHLRALAEEMKLSQAEVYEVATFYAHFDVVREDDTPPPELTIRVCDSLSCELAGAQQLLTALQGDYKDGSVRVVRAPCMGRCDTAPTVELGHYHVDHATPEKIASSIEAKQTHAEIPEYQSLAAYQKSGGYVGLEAMRAGKQTPDQVQDKINESGLRGLGGAGFPSGRKWSFVRAEKGPRYLAVNGDEGEPGTFKDRYYLEREPHRFLDGLLIAAWAVDAERAYIYMRDEYPAVLHILATEITALEQAGLIELGYIELRRGAGAYICGEESAMIESLEGKRGLPRHRPPYVAQVGLFDSPTLVHNVETLHWIARGARGKVTTGRLHHYRHHKSQWRHVGWT